MGKNSKKRKSNNFFKNIQDNLFKSVSNYFISLKQNPVKYTLKTILVLFIMKLCIDWLKSK